MERFKPLVTDAVKPLKRGYIHRPLMAVTAQGVLTEDGEYLNHDEYSEGLLTFESSYVITYGAETLLHMLHLMWRLHPRWQWRVNEIKAGNLTHTKVLYYGFRRTSGSAANSQLHYVINYDSYVRPHESGGRLADLMTVGLQLRRFCESMNIRVKATAAGTMAQLLRHPTFYQQPRRRVPQFINDAARKCLPANYYNLYTDAGQRIEAAVYVDQAAAHHHAAMTTPLPNANSITCQGYDRDESKVYARKSDHPDSLYRVTMQQHGLLRVTVRVPRMTRHVLKYALPTVAKAGTGRHIMCVWSNELPYLRSLGVEIESVNTVWGTDEVDRNLPRFARWAESVQSQYPWLKTALLTVYGMLAHNPSNSVVMHTTQGKGEQSSVLIGPYSLPSKANPVRAVEADTTNVLQRGLIEAHVRALSLDFARKCESRSIEVLSIYADGVFVRVPENTQLPLIRPWRQKEEINELEYECATRLRSRQLTRLPGTPRFKRNYLEEYRQ